MKSISTKAVVAVIATTLSLGGAWAAYAQAGTTPAPDTSTPAAPASPAPKAPMQNWRMAHNGNWGQRHMAGPAMENWGRGPRAALMNLVCSPRGKEMLEIAFVRLSYRLNLTSDQQSAFDDLKTTALDEQAKFADACQSAMPKSTAGQKPDPVDAMKARISLETARLAALNAVLPKFEALYSSLTDQQKADLMPPRMNPMGPRPGVNGMRQFGPMGHMGPGGQMGPRGHMGNMGRWTRHWNQQPGTSAPSPDQPQSQPDDGPTDDGSSAPSST